MTNQPRALIVDVEGNDKSIINAIKRLKKLKFEIFLAKEDDVVATTKPEKVYLKEGSEVCRIENLKKKQFRKSLQIARAKMKPITKASNSKGKKPDSSSLV